MSAFRTIKAIFCYMSAGYHFDRRNLVVSRIWMDRALVHSSEDFPYIGANNAIMLIFEDRHPEAQLWFTRCLESLSEPKNANQVYLSAFCDFYLACYCDLDRLHELEAIKARAFESNADRWLRQRFRFPSPLAINILIANKHSGKVTGTSSRTHGVDISLGW